METAVYILTILNALGLLLLVTIIIILLLGVVKLLHIITTVAEIAEDSSKNILETIEEVRSKVVSPTAFAAIISAFIKRKTPSRKSSKK
ncbi:hypothetical protein KC853_01840 [Candidatus Saccharibacteria bacterium]|nr:hypothetical protein [Candidatus Saccharibacteria bacterium]MCB9834938.1 hypothetical protein [Candidatus Nomurabacteria bacterium]